MYSLSIRIALEKEHRPVPQARLAAALELARTHDRLHARFPERINLARAARGEPLTRLSAAQRRLLEQLDREDEEDSEDRAAELRALPSAPEVLEAMLFALDAEEVLAAKAALGEALRTSLEDGG